MELSIKLYGDEKVSDEFKLAQTKSHENKFMPAQVNITILHKKETILR
jgi:hypothetical protein